MKLHKPFTVFLGLSIILTGCGSQEDTKDDESKNEVAQEEKKEVKKEQNIQIEEKILVKEDNDISLNISYPVISGMIDEREEKKINENFYKNAKKFEIKMRKAEEDLQELWADYGETNIHVAGTLNFNKTLINNRVLSIDNYYYEGEKDGNGMGYQRPFVYDLIEHKQITIANIFENDEIPQSLMSNMLNDAIVAELTVKDNYVKKIREDFPFYLTESDVVFCFDEYDLSSASMEIKIPKTQIPNLKEVYK